MDLSTITSDTRLQSRRQIYSQLDDGQIDSAITDAEQAVAKWCEIGGSDSVECISALSDLGRAVSAAGDHARALTLTEKARRLTLDLFGNNHPDSTFSMLALAACHLALCNFDQAADWISKGLEDIDRLHLQGSVLHARLLGRLSSLQLERGELQTAEAAAVEALVIQRRHFKCLCVGGLQQLAEILRAAGKTKLAESIDRKLQRLTLGRPT